MAYRKPDIDPRMQAVNRICLKCDVEFASFGDRLCIACNKVNIIYSSRGERRTNGGRRVVRKNINNRE